MSALIQSSMLIDWRSATHMYFYQFIIAEVCYSFTMVPALDLSLSLSLQIILLGGVATLFLLFQAWSLLDPNPHCSPLG